MKIYKYILLVLILISCTATKNAEDRPDANPTNYVVQWKSKGHEYGTVNYKIQRSRNNVSWSTLITVSPKFFPDSNIYTYTLPRTALSNYYRIIANMIKGAPFTLDTKYLPNTTQ